MNKFVYHQKNNNFKNHKKVEGYQIVYKILQNRLKIMVNQYIKGNKNR